MRSRFPEIKRIISIKDIFAKIICVLLAIILWAYITSTDLGEVKFKIPVTFTDLPDTLIKSQISLRYVTLTLNGRKDILKNVNVKEIKAVVNLDQPEVGVKKNYPIEVTKDEIPENIEVSLSSKEVSLLVERKIYKKVKVKVNIADRAVEGFVIGRIIVTPETVVMSGPESVVNKIDFIQTEKVSVSNITEKVIRDVSINTKNLHDVTLDVYKAKINIPLVETAGLSEFIKKIALKNIDDRYRYILSQDEVSVYLQADNPKIKLSGDDIDVFVDIGPFDFEEIFREEMENFIEKSYSVDVVIKRDGVKLISISPEIISIKIAGK